MAHAPGVIHELTQLHNRVRVFRDRTHAGEVMADMLRAYRRTDALVLGIPSGGLPVSAEIAQCLELPLDVAVVSKITLPWNSESGFGAVAFDGTVRLNEELMPHLGLTKRDIDRGIEKTTAKVNRRLTALRGERPLPRFANRPAILVDDGLASGFTMLVAIEALKNMAADHIVVAVPTAHAQAVETIVGHVVALHCPNIREGLSFAVADAYEHWRDLDEAEIVKLLANFHKESSAATIP